MYLTADLEIDEQIITPKQTGLLGGLFLIKTEKNENLKEVDETSEEAK